MKPTAVSFAATPPQVAWLSRYGGPLGPQAKRDLDALQDLAAIAEQGLTGRFTLAEALSLCEHLQNTPAVRTLANLPDAMAMTLHLAGEPAELSRKAGQLTPLEAYVVCHWVKAWWAGSGQERGDEFITRKWFRVKEEK